MAAPRTPYTVEPKTEIGRAIRTARLDKGLTQAQFAKKLEMSRWTVGMWETGEIIPDKESTRRMKRRFAVDLKKYMKQPAIIEPFKVEMMKETSELLLPTSKFPIKQGAK